MLWKLHDQTTYVYHGGIFLSKQLVTTEVLVYGANVFLPPITYNYSDIMSPFVKHFM